MAAALLIASLLTPLKSHAMDWGVAGHSPTGSYHAYRDVPLTQQLDALNALGVTYYRVDANSPSSIKPIVDLIRGNSAYSKLKIIPILYGPISWNDIKSNPRGYTNAYIYDSCKTAAQEWMKFWTANGYASFPFEQIEISNELDDKCINSGTSGESAEMYNDGQFERCKSIIQGLCDGIRAANPTIPRIVGCAGWLHYGFLDRLIAELGAPDWEILTYHWYSDMGPISRHSDVTTKLEGYMTKYHLPTWVTEVDCRDGSLPKGGETPEQAEARHGAKLAAIVRDMKQFPFIHTICVYELLDEPYREGGEAHYGLIRTTKNAGGKYEMNGQKPAVTSAYRDCFR